MTKTISRVVLLSGGMDSTTALAWALNRGPVLAALSVNYGQRHSKEIDHAAMIAQQAGVKHLVLDLSSWGKLLGGSALTDDAVTVPDGHYAAESMRITVVPNRNATMLMAAAGVAQALGAGAVVTAVHSGDHHIYPDCRPEFVAAASNAASLGTDGAVVIEAPFVGVSKTEIARIGYELGAPLHMSWSCYKGGEKHCGTCGTCVERREAFQDSGVTDPTEYEMEAVA